MNEVKQVFPSDPYLRDERRRGEQTERDRVLWLIEVRLGILRAMTRRGTEEDKQYAPAVLEELEDLEQAVRTGIHR